MSQPNVDARRNRRFFKQEPMKAPTRTPPSPGLLIFKSNGSNFAEAKEALIKHCLATFGNVAIFLTTGVQIVRDKPTPVRVLREYPDIEGYTNNSRSKMLLSLQSEYRTQLRVDDDASAKMFGLFQQLLEDEGTERVRSHAEWDNALASTSASILWRIIATVHTTHISNVTPGEALFNAMARFNRCVQLPRMTLTQYREAITAAVAVLTSLNHPTVPSEAVQARHMIHGLDKLQYGEYVADVLNAERRDPDSFPSTIQSVVDGARSFIPNSAVHRAQANVLAFATRVEDPAAAKQKGCHKCGSLDHWKKDCPVIKQNEGSNVPATSAAPQAAPPKSKNQAAAAATSKPKKAKPKRAYTTSISAEKDDFWDEVFHTFSMSLHSVRGSRVEAPVRSILKQVRFSFDETDTQKIAPPSKSKCIVNVDNIDYVTTGDRNVAEANILSTKIRRSRVVSLDTLADHSFTNNLDLIQNPQDRVFKIEGATGSGVGRIIGTLPGFGEIAYTPDSNASGISMSAVTSRYRVEFKPEVAFVVRINSKLTLHFNYNKKTKAYSCLFSDRLISQLSELESETIVAKPVSVSDMEKQYAKREVQRAREAVALSSKLFNPPAASLASFVNSGDILNCEVTGNDVALAGTIYGDVFYLRGREKFQGPTIARDVVVPTAKRKEQTIYADIMYWHGIPFVIFISKPLMLVLSQYIAKAQTLATMKDAFLLLCGKIEARGYSVTSIVVDPQSSLAALMNRIPYPVDIVGTGTHVADVEVEIRMIKEKLRSKESSLPWPVPKRIVRWFVYGATSVTNMFRRKGASLCPRTEFTGVKLDYKRDLRSEPGEYCEVNVATGTSNSSKETPRTVPAISLCGTGNSRGTQWFLDLETMKPFLADRWKVLPTPDWVIEKMKLIHDIDEVSFSKPRAGKLRSGRQGVLKSSDGDQMTLKDIVHLPPQRDEVEIDVDGAVAPAGQDDGAHSVVAVPSDSDYGVPSDMTTEQSQVSEAEDASLSIEAENSDEYLTTAAPDKPVEDEEPDDTIDYIADPYDNLETARHVPDASLGARFVSGQRKSYRIEKRLSARAVELRTLRAYKMSIAKAMKRNEHATKKAIQAELQQMLSKDVWELVDRANLTKKQLRGIIRSSLFLKDKYDAAGNFIKSKARLVAGGDGQDKSIYDLLSSPTVSHESVMMILAIAAVQKRDVATIDITGAYLECVLPDTDEVIMELSPILARLLAELDPSVTNYTDENGKVLVKLKKALYGCVQSALLWYNKLRGVLVQDGFGQNDYDPCVFNKDVDGAQVSIAFHVDDLLVTSTSTALVDGVASMLERNFESVSVTRGLRHSYLAMNLVITESGIDIDMIAYIEKVLEGRTLGSAKVTTPATDDLFKTEEDDELLPEQLAKAFHSDVAKLLYVAKRTRLEILLSVSQLSSKVTAPVASDQKKLLRLFDYLNATKGAILHLSSGGPVKISAYIDASFGIHEDGTSRTGVVLQMAGVGIAGWTGKQKLVTKSSTESEVVALSDGLTHVLWAREFLTCQGHDVTPLVVYQDNQSVLSLMQTGRMNKHRTKHLNVRYFFAKDRVECGEIGLAYMPTTRMLADLLTKPLSGETFKQLVKQLYGHKVS